MKKVAVVGTVGVPAQYGGFETLVEYLTSQLGGNVEFTVYCSSIAYKEKMRYHNKAKLKYIPLKANGAQSIIYDIISLFFALFKRQTILILGVSGCIVLPIVRCFFKNRIIVNIDGMEWKREKWGFFAKKFLKFSERCAVKFSDIVIADNDCISEYVYEEYGVQAQMIAYGGDHVQKIKLSEELLSEYPWLSEPYAFKVCRIEPENNIHIILEAFSKLSMQLVIVGNWKSSEYGVELKKKYSQCDNIRLLDPIYDQNILNQIRSNTDIYIHGHSAGGTNPSLVEAMCLGLPIVAFGVNYNCATTENQAIYFNNTQDLFHIISGIEAYNLDQIRISMTEISKRKYSWLYISECYKNLF